MNKRSPKTQRMEAALEEIAEERNYQMARWSTERDEGHTPVEWLALLTVYMGKAAMVCPPYTSEARKMSDFRKRVKQIGAICAAILEATDE